ncbi:MAG: hypothetical protein JNG85_03850 [Spirochaetaceae bacterium]|nr:hypothetical protein [Spirochaetaceae bacterium]
MPLWAACSLPFGSASRERLTLRLPPPPAAWAGLPGLDLIVRWRDASGLRREARAPFGERLGIEVARGLPQAILAYPRSAGRPGRPAGLRYPAAGSGIPGAADPGAAVSSPVAGPRELEATWLGGWAAAVFAELEAKGLDGAAFDLDRLERVAADYGGDPWRLEPREAAGRLATGRFRSDALKPGSGFLVSLPGPGPWAPESPLAPMPRLLAPGEPPAQGPAAEGGYATELPEGLYRFLGPAAELALWIDGAGNGVAIPIPP